MPERQPNKKSTPSAAAEEVLPHTFIHSIAFMLSYREAGFNNLLYNDFQQ